jgi:hypothetical protein
MEMTLGTQSAMLATLMVTSEHVPDVPRTSPGSPLGPFNIPEAG